MQTPGLARLTDAARDDHTDARGQAFETQSVRYHRGWRALEAVGGDHVGQLTERIDRFSPAMTKLLVETAYADIISRPELSLKYREFATVAVLAAQGNSQMALRLHCRGMLNTDWAPRALIEAALIGVVEGSPRSIDLSVDAVCEVLNERHARTGPMESVGPTVSASDIPCVGGVDNPACEHARQRFAHRLTALPLTMVGDGNVNAKDRQLASLAVAVARDCDDATLREQLWRSLTAGWTSVELAELIMQLTAFVVPVAEILDSFDDSRQAGRHNPAAQPA